MNKLFVIGIKMPDGHQEWVTDFEGAEGRTTVLADATVFTSYVAANNNMAKMRKKFENRKFWVESVEIPERQKV